MDSNRRSNKGDRPRVLTVQDVADYFLTHQEGAAEPITNKRLQKLVYLAHGTTLALLHRSLWDTDEIGTRVTAYKEGPVVPDLWRTYRQHRFHTLPVPTNVDLSGIDPIARAILDAVLHKYRSLTTAELTNLTHADGPWVKAWARAQEAVTSGYKPLGYDVIPDAEIKNYFARIWAGETDPRKLTDGELSTAVHAQPGRDASRAEALAQVASGQGMSLGELRRYLDL